jgi:hypothetical protein
MERSLLHPDCIDLKDPLESASEAVRVQAGWAAAQWAIRHNRLTEVELLEARLGDSPEPVAAIVEQLDDHYFDLNEAPEANDAAVQSAFRRARAANALECAMQGEAYDAIYEARASTDDVVTLRQVVLEALRPGAAGGH